jgi:hypothetical protein
MSEMEICDCLAGGGVSGGYRDDPDWQAAQYAYVREDYDDPEVAFRARVIAIAQMYKIEIRYE